MNMTKYSLPLLVTMFLAAPLRGDGFPKPTLNDIDPSGIRGALVICGGGDLPDVAVEQFVELAGGEEGRLVVIPTAAANADEAEAESYVTTWQDRGIANVQVLHTRDRAAADSDELIKLLDQATAVWFAGGQQSRLAETYVGTRVEDAVYAVLKRGGAIGGTSAGAAIQSRLMIARGNPDATLMRGLDLLPGAVIDQHFKARQRKSRLTSVLEENPGYYGLGVDEHTALIVRGRRIQVVGQSTLTVCFSASANRPALQYEVPAERDADLTALRRAAIARAAPQYPPEVAPKPHVEHGALMIVGGGMTEEMRLRFVELAGGPDAQIVVVPTAVAKPRLEDRYEIRQFTKAGAKSVAVLHTTDRKQAERNGFIEPLRQATGVWFGGGRQWRIVDAYEGTATEEAFHDVLRRGGVIGGSSAGATIQGDYLVRGNPLGNYEMMAEGYERGFAFLPGCAIDQHFTQRRRQPDMESLKNTFPQLLGIGIDENTAIIVKKSTAEVIGKHDVYFYGGSPEEDSDAANTKVPAGESYDLKRQRKID